VLGTCASIRVGFIAIVMLRRLSLMLVLMLIMLIMLMLLMVTGRGAGLIAIAWGRRNAAMENAILCGRIASSGGSIATAMWWTV